jgi:hypothetical protein
MVFCCALPPASASSFLVLLFHPEDGGGIVLRKVKLSPNYMTLQPKDITFSTNIYYIFKSMVSFNTFMYNFKMFR